MQVSPWCLPVCATSGTDRRNSGGFANFPQQDQQPDAQKDHGGRHADALGIKHPCQCAENERSDKGCRAARKGEQTEHFGADFCRCQTGHQRAAGGLRRSHEQAKRQADDPEPELGLDQKQWDTETDQAREGDDDGFFEPRKSSVQPKDAAAIPAATFIAIANMITSPVDMPNVPLA
jgi:hypothetical protein